MQLQSNVPLSDHVLVSTELTNEDGDYFIPGFKKNRGHTFIYIRNAKEDDF